MVTKWQKRVGKSHRLRILSTNSSNSDTIARVLHLASARFSITCNMFMPSSFDCSQMKKNVGIMLDYDRRHASCEILCLVWMRGYHCLKYAIIVVSWLRFIVLHLLVLPFSQWSNTKFCHSPIATVYDWPVFTV